MNEQAARADMARRIKRRQQLEELYAQVPASACANSGECCQLTDEQAADGRFAVMFPLYRVEYENIRRHIEARFPPERHRALLSFREERPRVCPFLGDDNRCTIYEVRPLVCRTYGLLTVEQIERTARELEGDLSDQALLRFVSRERFMTCPRVMVTEPAKVARHIRNQVAGVYERALVRLGQAVPITTDPGVLGIIGRVPDRFTWGGFNSLRAPRRWVRQNLRKFWSRRQFAEFFRG